MRIAVVDIGTNSTRLLLADVAADGSITELARRSEVTRLGGGADAYLVKTDFSRDSLWSHVGRFLA